jgi:hypothetical protein
MFWQFFIALALAGVAYFITHKTGMSTGFLFGFLSFINLLTGGLILLTILPILISLPMVLKHISMPKAGAAVMANAENLGNREG